MNHFAMPQAQEPQKRSYIISCEVQVTIFRKVLSKIYGTLCEPLEIPGRPPMVHLDHVENHWFNATKERN